MRFSLLSKVFVFGVIVLAGSCKKQPEDLRMPYRQNVPALLATRVSSYDLQEVNFSFDLAVLKGDNETKEVQEFTGLPDSSFRFIDFLTTFPSNNTWVTHIIEKTEYVDSVRQNTFSTIFLIDQSEGPEKFDSTDYYNQRFQAFNAFYSTLNRQGNVVFSAYSRTTTSHNVLRIINNEFSDSWDEATAKSLLDLTHDQSGSSGLFDALEQAIRYFSAYNSENKSITLFVRNKDDGKSNLNLAGIIDLANLNHVKINVIWLIRNTANVDLNALRQLSSKTGGFSVYMGSIYQSSSVFLGLTKLLRMEMSFYRVFVKMNIGAPNYFLPKYSTGVYLYYSPEFTYWNYVPLYLEKP
ncbi:MAG: VWA domain-containing protein [Bacteroidetes bacterium]|nr:MAG: VWA domain-containing protein [Bacteroidota bacterium]